jgi:FkbM family methyltransferase
MVATVAHPWAKDSSVGIYSSMPGVLVMHHFEGSWKVKHGYKSCKMWSRFKRWAMPDKPDELVPIHTFSATPQLEHYPVSVNLTDTIFTVMVNLVGHGDLQSHEDPSHALTTYGNWQAGMDNTASPRAAAALIGALSRAAEAHPETNLSFLDIGAGLGLYTLTAAARGHHVYATELAARSVALLNDSIRRNGVEELVTLHNVTIGEKVGIACVEPDQNDISYHNWLPEDVQRGFAAPRLHDQATSQGCGRHVRRVTMKELVPEGTRIGAVRISAGAWTAAVLRGGLKFLQTQRPAAILIEVDMNEMSHIGENDFLSVLEQLMAMGYRNLGHAGRVCVERFEGMLAALTNGGVRDPMQADANKLKQPVWCELDASTLPSMLERNRRNGVEKQDPMLAIGVEPILLQLDASSVVL